MLQYLLLISFRDVTASNPVNQKDEKSTGAHSDFFFAGSCWAYSRWSAVSQAAVSDAVTVAFYRDKKCNNSDRSAEANGDSESGFVLKLADCSKEFPCTS